MNIDRIVFLFAGFLIMLTTGLAYFYNPHWMFVTIFVGLMVFQSALTRWCPFAIILKKLGVKSGSVF